MRIRIQEKLRLTPGKPQAATQAKYAFVPPAVWLAVSCKVRSGIFIDSGIIKSNRMNHFKLKIFLIAMISTINLICNAQIITLDSLVYPIDSIQRITPDIQDLINNQSPPPEREYIYNPFDNAIENVVFPGGEDELFKFLQKNVNYPTIASKAKLEGRVIAKFDIDSIGNTTNIRIIKSISPEFDNEVIRVISIMPCWKWNDGWKPKYRYAKDFNLPINFLLNKKNKPLQ